MHWIWPITSTVCGAMLVSYKQTLQQKKCSYLRIVVGLCTNLCILIMHCPRQVVYQPNMHYEQWILLRWLIWPAVSASFHVKYSHKSHTMILHLHCGYMELRSKVLETLSAKFRNDEVTRWGRVTDVTPWDILSCCISPIMHRPRGVPNSMHYEKINCI
jgi:hypothetical protein